MKKYWYDYLWIVSLSYLILGFLVFSLLGGLDLYSNKLFPAC